MSEVAKVTQTAEDKKRQEQWEAEEDIRTLQRAAEIKKDPKRLKRAEMQAKAVVSAISDV